MSTQPRRIFCNNSEQRARRSLDKLLQSGLPNVTSSAPIAHSPSNAREGSFWAASYGSFVKPQNLGKTEMTQERSEMINKSEIARRLPILFIALAAVSGAFFLRDYLTFEALSNNRSTLIAFRDANYFMAVLTFIAIYALVAGLSLPGATIMTLTGGFLFATFPGFLYNVTGATLGATAVFVAARWGFGAQMAARMEESDGAVRRIKEGIDANQWSMLFLIRLVPIVPFFLANLIPSLLDVPLRRFIISTFFGIIPGAVVYTSIGAGLGSIFETGETPDLGIIFSPQILLPILGLCLLALAPIIFKTLRPKESQK